VGNKMSNKYEEPEDDLSFILWKAELNKELYSFWKTMTDAE